MAGPSSIIGAFAVRVARLTADGTPDFGNPTGGFMLCSGISQFEHDFETEDGEDVFERDAAGNACVIRKFPDLTKRVTFTLTMCKSDYRLDEILGVAAAITSGGTVVGRAFNMSAGCGTGTPFNGCSIELWSQQWDCSVPLAGSGFMRTVLPRCYLTPAGFTREQGVSMPVYTGYSTPNANYGDGPFGDLDILVSAGVGANWAMVDVDNTVVPACVTPAAYVNIPPSAS